MEGISHTVDHRKVLFVLLPLLLLCAAIMNLEAQNADVPKGLRIDPARPFVYLKFDHIGEGARQSDQEPATRIWLRLVNNCWLPIVVMGGGKVVGGLKDEVYLDNDVVPTRRSGVPSIVFSRPEEPTQAPMEHLNVPAQDLSQQTSANSLRTESAPQQEPSGGDESEMPLGYPSGDVVSYETIRPGKEVLFSVPVNFVTREWHFEIGFNFDSEGSDGIPERKAFTTPDVRGSVRTILAYGFWDLPERHRAEVERLNQILKPTR